MFLGAELLPVRDGEVGKFAAKLASGADLLFCGRKAFGSFLCGGIHGDDAMDLRHGQYTLDHGAAGGEAEGAASFREARKGFHDLADHGAINVIYGGHIEDDVIFLVLDVVFDFLIDAFAIGAHLHAAA
jgi:hypothetical protein